MLVPILMGSKSDESHARKIAEHLERFGVKAELYVCSAHKVPELVLSIVDDFNKANDDICYITIAGRSNGLSGVVAANSIHPVIACPPFKDKSDYLANIHSSVQMPSDTPAMVVVDPQNPTCGHCGVLRIDYNHFTRICRHVN